MKILLHDYGGYAFIHPLSGEIADSFHKIQYMQSETTHFLCVKSNYVEN
jgi:hypothetical protein